MSYEEYSQRYMVGAPEQIVERLQPLVEAGVTYVITYLSGVAYDPTPVRRFAEEVIPGVGLGATRRARGA